MRPLFLRPPRHLPHSSPLLSLVAARRLFSPLKTRHGGRSWESSAVSVPFTIFHCLSLCFHCLSLPFIVYSLPFTAFPCVFGGERTARQLQNAAAALAWVRFEANAQAAW